MASTQFWMRVYSFMVTGFVSICIQWTLVLFASWIEDNGLRFIQKKLIFFSKYIFTAWKVMWKFYAKMVMDLCWGSTYKKRIRKIAESLLRHWFWIKILGNFYALFSHNFSKSGAKYHESKFAYKISKIILPHCRNEQILQFYDLMTHQ